MEPGGLIVERVRWLSRGDGWAELIAPFSQPKGDSPT